MDIINELQNRVDPHTFTPRAVYDGRKNLFSIRLLPFGEDNTREVPRIVLMHRFLHLNHVIDSSLSL
jgi:hypothetical protein